MGFWRVDELKGQPILFGEQHSALDAMVASSHHFLLPSIALAFVAVFDNCQDLLPKKNQTVHQSAVVHKGTYTSLLKQVKEIELLKGTVIKSSCGLRFKVTSCKPHPHPDYPNKCAF
jgi:hypothetical protein